MRFPRQYLKRRQGAVYHCISRTVNGERLLSPVDQEVFRRQLWRVAAFCGVEILTYCLLSNHFHLLVRIPEKRDFLPDGELIRRVRLLSGPDKAKATERELKCPAGGERVRESLLNRMHDLSFFMKELKQRFTIYYNHTHDRFGTLWAERYKSLLVEDEPETLKVVAAYIDLNPLRAGLCTDPKDYRFCGYGEAVGGSAGARCGLRRLFGNAPWQEARAAYRLILFGKGYFAKNSLSGRVSEEELHEVQAAQGGISLQALLRCRLRYLSDGIILGSERYVRTRLDAIGLFKKGRRKIPRATGTGYRIAVRVRRSGIG